MKEIILIFIISISFSAFVFFDFLSYYCRVSGSINSLNATGASVEKMMNTLKRVSIFFYPPILGYFVYKNDVSSLFLSIYISNFFAVMVAFLCYFNRLYFIRYFIYVLIHMSNNRGLKHSFMSKDHKGDSIKLHKNPANIFNTVTILSIWISFFYSSIFFILNLIVIKMPDIGSIVYQTNGLLNGLATIAVSFVLDPILARHFDNKKERSIAIVENVIVGHIINYTIIFPIFFGLVWFSY